MPRPIAGELTSAVRLLDAHFSINGAGARQRAPLSQLAAFLGRPVMSTQGRRGLCNGAIIDRPAWRQFATNTRFEHSLPAGAYCKAQSCCKSSAQPV